MELGWRKVFKRQPSGSWKEISITDLRQDDVFTIWNPDGSPVLYKGELLMKALTDTYLDEEKRCFTVNSMSLKEWEETRK